MKTDSYLKSIFDEVNRKHFRNKLPPIRIRFKPDIGAADARFVYERKRSWINIGLWFTSEHRLINAVKHEIVHYWQWLKYRTYPKMDMMLNHTQEFKTIYERINV